MKCAVVGCKEKAHMSGTMKLCRTHDAIDQRWAPLLKVATRKRCNRNVRERSRPTH